MKYISYVRLCLIFAIELIRLLQLLVKKIPW
ncbi:hypothetical protein SRABI89_05196 [Pseudomonas koreensis]|nr:hypothetical protein SRABI89_05196 [Pseudomonas koreensis]